MSQSFNYKRKFIILKDDMTTISGIKPKGHGKIEIRGSKGYISLNVDNGEEDQEYKGYLIGEKDGDIVEVYLGRIFTNERGKGRVKTDVNINNVKNTNISLGKFSGILIKRNSNILLSAYIDKNDGLISKYIVKLQEEIEETEETKIMDVEPELEDEEIVGKELNRIETEEIIPEKEESYSESRKEEKEEKEEIYDELEKEEVEEEKEQNYSEFEKEEKEKEEISFELQDLDKLESTETIEEIEEDIDSDSNIEKLTLEELEKVENESDTQMENEELIQEQLEYKEKEFDVEEIEIENIIEEINDDIKDKEMEKVIEEKINSMGNVSKDHYKNMDYIRKLNYKNRLNNYVLSILKFFPYINPFTIQLKGYDWWRIEYDDVHSYRGFLPFSNYLNNMSYNHPFMSNTVSPASLMKEYNHYIFGMYKEYDDVIYYVYGVPGKFVSSEHPYKGVSGFNTWFEGKGDYGYWLLYIEPITGKVLFPLNPTIPFK
ncbi:MAG TPA: hypothetical protein VK071_00160 [Tissierellales bacterium]|nr:hypothetical protein [Tissierellales bacterium]